MTARWPHERAVCFAARGRAAFGLPCAGAAQGRRRAVALAAFGRLVTGSWAMSGFKTSDIQILAMFTNVRRIWRDPSRAGGLLPSIVAREAGVSAADVNAVCSRRPASAEVRAKLARWNELEWQS